MIKESSVAVGASSRAPLNSMPWLADLISVPPHLQDRIPQELVKKNYESGRIVLEDGDPHISLLALLGCSLYRIQRLDWKPPGVEPDE